MAKILLAKMMIFTLCKKYLLVSQLFRLFPNSGIATEMQTFEIMGVLLFGWVVLYVFLFVLCVFLLKGQITNFAIVFDYFILSDSSN